MKNKFLNTFLLALSLTILCIFMGYFFLDQPLALWVHNHKFSDYLIFKWMTFIASFIGALAFLFIPTFAFLFLKRSLKKIEKIFFFASLSVAIASFLKDALKIIFGRYWISTWTHQNLSLLENNAYGFNFLSPDASFHSFPSGHTVVTCSALTFFWVYFPKYRVPVFLLAFLQALGQIGMNYHYLSDILAGAFLGIFTSLFFIKIVDSRRQVA